MMSNSGDNQAQARATFSSPEAVIYFVVHTMPERLRVKVPALKYEPELAAGFERALHCQAGVSRVSASWQSTSVTIEFGSGEFEPIAWLDKLRLSDIVPVKQQKRHFNLPAPLAALRRGTFAFENLVPPRTQFALGAVSFCATVFGAPVIFIQIALSAAVLPIANRAAQTLLDERRVGAEALDAVSCLILIGSGEFFPASVMTFLLGVGEFVRDSITRRCEDMITHQLALSRRSAWLVKGKRRVRVPVIDLRAGDKLVVYPGELIAFHGVVEEGAGTVVPASPEMDFEPEAVCVGDTVRPDLLLTEGKLYVRHDGCTFLRREDLVRQKQKKRWLQRTLLHRGALRVGYDRIWPMLGLAGLLFALTRDLHRAMTLICFDFITGIRITLPVAVLASMYRAGQSGIVIRNASALEKLAAVDVVIFARGGTLTSLNPCVSDVYVSAGFSLDEVTSFAVAVEQRYNHLAAYAIYSFAKLKKITVPERTSSNIIAGLGVKGNVDGRQVLVGSTRLMEMENIALASAQEFLDICTTRGDSRACVAIDGQLAGIIAYQDPLRPETREVIARLKQLGIDEVVVSTGASQAAASALANQAGIEKVFFRHTAEDKRDLVKEYKRQGRTVAVVGSDLNDSLALELADVAITFGTGTELARHRADVVLDSKSLLELTEAIAICRNGMALARENLLLVSVPNWFGLGLSLLHGTEVLAATLLNNGSVIVGVANGLRPLIDAEFEGGEGDDEEQTDEDRRPLLSLVP